MSGPGNGTGAKFRRLAVLIAVNVVDMIGFMVVLPLLPFYAQELHATPELIGALIASFSIAQLLAAPVWGRVSDRYGRRPALLIGLTASAVAYVVFGLADALWLLFLSRIVQGAGARVVFADGPHDQAAMAVVAHPVEPARDDRVQPREATRRAQRGDQHRFAEAPAAAVEHRELQVLARTEMREHAALGHAHRLREFADREAFEPGAASDRVGLVEDQLARGSAFGGDGLGGHALINSTTVRSFQAPPL